MAAKLSAARASAVAVLGVSAKARAAAAPRKTKHSWHSRTVGVKPNLGRWDWRVQGIGGGLDFNFRPPSVSRMVTRPTCAGEWVAWVHYDVRVHHSTVKHDFKSQGCYMVTGCKRADAENVLLSKDACVI